uniref:Putative cyclase n=1 Tax=Sphingomonas sp. KSM1 TaxID=1228049 RepID=M1VQK3_9SPHN|nr:putative cyclase [Sphingomonas sp. KSM1]
MNVTSFGNCDCCSPTTDHVDPSGEHSPSDAELSLLFDKVRNWGRWGDDDQRGTLNHIGGAEVARAAALVREGRHVSMSRPFPTEPGVENPRPAQHFMAVTGEDRHAPHVPGMETTFDYIGISFHGMSCTHIDALCHLFHRGLMYNGGLPSEVRSRGGASSNSITVLADGVVGRGVLLDIPSALGIDFVEPDRLVTIEDLELAERKVGVSVGKGDILMVRIGRDVRPDRGDGRIAGLHPSVAGWLHERDVAVLGGDGPNDAMPPGLLSAWPTPIHDLCVAGMGIPLVDNLYLERVTEVCVELDRWTFQVVVAPLVIRGGTGSPINPIAIF